MVLTVIAAVRGDDGSEVQGPQESTTTVAAVSRKGQELLDRLAAGRELDLHITYEPDAAEVAAEGSQLRMELWRKGDYVRQDLLLSMPGVVTQLAAFQRPDGNFFCQRAAEAEWECEAARSTATEAGAPAGIIEAAAADLGGAEVTTKDETVAGGPARCYAIAGGDGASTMCVTEDGVPVRLAVEGQTLTATEVERSVDSATFELPAEVEPAGAATPGSSGP